MKQYKIKEKSNQEETLNENQKKQYQRKIKSTLNNDKTVHEKQTATKVERQNTEGC